MKLKLLLPLLIIASTTWAQYVPQSGLIAWYPFNGNANDESTSGFNMTVDGAILTLDRFSRVGKAYKFDGIDDEISYSNVISTPGDFTLSYWAFIDGVQNGILVYNGDDNTNGIGFVISDGVGGIGDKLTFFSGGIGPNTVTSISLHLWHHIVLRRTGVTYDVFIDNNIAATVTGISSFPPIGKFHIGIDYTNGTNPFSGNIDDISVYNRAITDIEVDTIFNGCAPVTIASNIISVLTGTNAILSVSYSSTPATFQWQQNIGAGWNNVVDDATYIGSNTANLTIANAPLNLNNAIYKCIVSNDIGCIDTSAIITLSVFCGTQITNTIPSVINVYQGSTAVFPIITFSSLGITYQWQQNTGSGWVNLNNSGNYSGTDTNVLKISNTPLALNNSMYRCVIASGALCADTSAVSKLIVFSSNGVNTISGDDLVTVYPNPSEGSFNVVLNNIPNVGGGKLIIQNMVGQKVYEKQIRNKGFEQVDYTGSKGVYTLSVMDKDNNMIAKKRLVIR